MKKWLRNIRTKLHGDIINELGKQNTQICEMKSMISQQCKQLAELSKINASYSKVIANICDSTEHDLHHKISSIYRALSDEQSKSLFWGRLQSSVSKDPCYLLNEMLNIDRKIKVNDMISILKRNMGTQVDKLILYCESTVGKQVYNFFTMNGVSFSLICTHEKLQSSKTMFKLPAISEDELIESHADSHVILGVNDDYTLKRHLLKRGFKSDNIYRRKGLWDEQYFVENLMIPGKNEVFIDGGSYNLQSSVKFAQWCNGHYDAIYAFEPDSANYKRCLVALEKTKSLLKEKCNVINSGLWHEPGTISFNESGQQGAAVSESGLTPINVARIDDLSQKITFIKLDVEGSELNALQGSRDTIQKHRPKLAICIYHKPEDIIEIPNYILSLVPDYKLYIRHHSTWLNDTVLYCI